jgi:hypothetical protein
MTNQTNSLWTDEIIAKLKLLWPSHTGTEISDILATDHHVWFTRCAIIGKAARLGLPTKGPMARKPKVAKPKPARLVSSMPPRRRQAYEMAEAPTPFKPRVVEIVPLHIQFGELSETTCKWECSGQDNPRLFTFCGHPQDRGSFCFHHANIGYVPPNSNRRPYIPGRAA